MRCVTWLGRGGMHDWVYRLRLRPRPKDHGYRNLPSPSGGQILLGPPIVHNLLCRVASIVITKLPPDQTPESEARPRIWEVEEGAPPPRSHSAAQRPRPDVLPRFRDITHEFSGRRGGRNQGRGTGYQHLHGEDLQGVPSTFGQPWVGEGQRTEKDCPSPPRF